MLFNVSPPIDRIFLDVGPFTIYWYAVIIVSGVFLGLWMASREANRLGLQKDLFTDLIIFALPIAIISARLYYVIFEWEQYQGGPWWRIFAVWEGGIAIHGALIGSVITAIVFARVKKVSFWQLADIAAPGLLLGQAIGRWGNFINQEAHGGKVSDAAYDNFIRFLPDFIENQMYIDGVLYHPTFLYESVLSFIGVILILVLRKYNPLRGEIFLGYIIWYSIGRYFIEGMRTDSLYIIGSLRTAQVISIVLVVVCGALIAYRRKSKTVNRRYSGKKV